MQKELKQNILDADTEEPTSSSGGSDVSASDDDQKQSPVLRSRNVKKVPAATSVQSSQACPANLKKGSMAGRFKSLMAIVCLWGFAPVLLLLALLAKIRHCICGGTFQAGSSAKKKQLRILVTGGKMSKASAVARAVGRDGHKVFTAEIMPYKFCHTRFCSHVSKHYVLPRPTVQPEEWEAAIQAIVKEHDIDLIIPCTAPVESSAYAHLRERLPSHVRSFQLEGETSDKLDNKYTFNKVLVDAGLPCPETANMECLDDAVRFFKARENKPDDGKRFIVKPAVYDPKARTEILFLPIEDKHRQMEYLRSRNASKAVPYVIQEVLNEPEYGSYAIFNKGSLTGFEFFESAASCLVYRQLREQYGEVMELCKGLG